MSKIEKILNKIKSGKQDTNISFDELKKAIEYFGFELRIKGSHHIFFKEDIKEIINIQNNKGSAKPYQVKQLRELINKYFLKQNGFKI